MMHNNNKSKTYKNFLNYFRLFSETRKYKGGIASNCEIVYRGE